MLLLFLFALIAAQSNVISDVAVTLYPGVASSYLAQKTPVSFGMPFVRGDVPSGDRVALHDSAAGVTHDAQLDCLSTYNGDGSCRHGVVTALFNGGYVGATEDKQLLVIKDASTPAAAKTKAQAISRLQSLGVQANATFQFGANTYFVDAVAAVSGGSSVLRLRGHHMSELVVRAWPLHTQTGAAHTQIEVQLAVRVYHNNANFVHFDFHIENTRMNFTTGAPVKGYGVNRIFASPTYTVTVEAGAATKTETSMQHHYGTRWHRQYFYPLQKVDAASLYYVTHNARYWSASRAVPSYDYANKAAPSTNSINGYYNNWLNSGQLYPLGHGIVTKYMPQTGGRDDIGLLPEWTAKWLFKPSSYKLYEVMMHSGDVGGAFEVHWRHRLSVYGGDWIDIEVDPLITAQMGAYGHQHMAQWTSPWTPDCAHQPSLAYVPFLASGSLYYEDEMAYWSIWSVAKANPGNPSSYRQQHKGVVSETVRGNGWCWRQMNHAMFYLPDGHPKNALISRNRNNTMNFWSAQAPGINPLGYFALNSGTAQSYKYDPEMSSAISHYSSPWQHDFLTTVVQHAYELELPAPAASLKSLRDYIANWTVNRFHSKWGAVFDRSYAAPYHFAQRYYAGGYVQTMQDIWFHSFDGDNLKPIDGLGNCGPVNPSSCGLCYPYGARGTLKILNASNDVFDVTDAATYLSNNLVVSVSHYKWALAGVREQHPYAQTTSAPTPSPTPPTLPPPTSSPPSPTPQPPTGSSPTPQPHNTRPPTLEPTPTPASPTPASPTPASPTPAPPTPSPTPSDATTAPTPAPPSVDGDEAREGASADDDTDWLPYLVAAAAVALIVVCGVVAACLCLSSGRGGAGASSRQGSRAQSRRASSARARYSSQQYPQQRRASNAMRSRTGSTVYGGGATPNPLHQNDTMLARRNQQLGGGGAPRWGGY